MYVSVSYVRTKEKEEEDFQIGYIYSGRCQISGRILCGVEGAVCVCVKIYGVCMYVCTVGKFGASWAGIRVSVYDVVMVTVTVLCGVVKCGVCTRVCVCVIYRFPRLLDGLVNKFC